MLAACGGTEDVTNGPIDERLGTYRGVGLGDIEREVFPVFVSAPGMIRGEEAYRYPGAGFFVSGRRLAAVTVTARGARTRKGVAIGDSLAKVRRLYRARCG